MLFHQQKKNLNRAFKPPISSNNSIPQSEKLTEKHDENPKITNEKQYFRIYFSKDVKKKHKVFDEGVLVVSGNKCQIFNSEGKQIFDASKPKNIQQFLESDEPMTLGFSYYIEIIKQLSKESFESGEAFIQASNIQLPKIDPKLKKKNLQTKTQITSEIPIDCFMLCEPKETFNTFSCYIESFLSKLMRPHQQEGVKFMLQCICGFKGSNINGCILADSMGLGKTLQSIALVWTLLRQNPFCHETPFLKKVLIITPVSLIKNWENEIKKWLGNNRLIPLVAIGTREEVLKTINSFCEAHYRCLIISYESFRINVERFTNHCDLMILDEGHRIKNMNIKTFQAFSKTNCTKRIILTGTPLQNSLDEFYSCVSFVNPGLFPSLTTFRRVFSIPIMDSLKKNATQEILNLSKERSKELSKIISNIILRRQPNLLKKMLPPKHEFLIFVRMTDIQSHIYQNTIKEKTFQRKLLDNKTVEVLPFIMALRKILNHPHILLKDDSELSKQLQRYLFQKTNEFGWDCSHKFKFLVNVLNHVKSLQDPSEKIIIVSYFTQTLDMIEKLCREMGFKLVRLDGKVPATKRQLLVDKFNNVFSGIQVFLLCAKAGGTGLNLIGANRMILFEVDWNPSNDLQVMGRIWRDGQRKPVYIYRLITSGTLEEKILQRQILKGNISDNVVDEKFSEFQVDDENIKRLFDFKSDSECETFAYEENELFELTNLSSDFNEEMANYITFIKEKKDVQNCESLPEDEKLNNLFDAENAFIPEKTEENQQETEEPEGDSFENPTEKNENIEEALDEYENINENSEKNLKENEKTNKNIDEKEISNEKENFEEELKENLKENPKESLKENNDKEKAFKENINKDNENLQETTKENFPIKSLEKSVEPDDEEKNSKKRKFPNENILKIFAKITKNL